ncbi:MAG: hypothetical protein IJ986_02695 [Bacteroidales bacterium]|nr:hypothetical protein [Bacteroidales bacterium]
MALEQRKDMEHSEVHIGKLVKAVFDGSGLTVAELARRLHCERTNVYTIFRRRSIDVELLARLSNILGHNFLDDAMRLYGLSAPSLNLTLRLDHLSAEKLSRLSALLAELQTET